MCLSIAFEALLDLPPSDIRKTFSSYISNFFDEQKDLIEWSIKFYDLRSRIVHGDEVVFEKLSRIGRRLPCTIAQ
jgi:hypothetical protein